MNKTAIASLGLVLVLMLALAYGCSKSSKGVDAEHNDTTPPTVTAHYPDNGAATVPVLPQIEIYFSEAMNRSTLPGPAVTIDSTISLSLQSYIDTVDDHIAYYTVPAALSHSTTYSVKVTTAVRDVAGNAMQNPYTWSFSTAPETTPPDVTAVSPSAGATDVPVDASIIVTFSEPVDPASLNSTTFFASPSVAGTISCTNGTATLDPTASLGYQTDYHVTLTTGVRDLAGNPMAQPYSWSFRTMRDTASAPGVTFGGAGSDGGVDIISAPDGNPVILANTASKGAGGEDYWLLEADTAGNVIWDNTYGGGEQDSPQDAAFASDGGFVVAGETKSFGGGVYGPYDILLVKTDAYGQESWHRTLGWDSTSELAASVLPVSSGYLVAGTHMFRTASNEWYARGYVAKTDFLGQTEWQRVLHTGEYHVVNRAAASPDAGFVLVGSHSQGFDYGTRLEITKVNANGSVVWSKYFGTNAAGANDNFGHDIQPYAGGYIITGETGYLPANPLSSQQLLLLCVDANGDPVWSRAFGNAHRDAGYGVTVVSDGFLIVGVSFVPEKLEEIYVVKTDFSGNSVWERRFGGNGTDSGRRGMEIADGSLLIVGSTETAANGTDVVLLRLDQDGNVIR